jgi:hypothetical protein
VILSSGHVSLVLNGFFFVLVFCRATPTFVFNKIKIKKLGGGGGKPRPIEVAFLHSGIGIGSLHFELR